jgi:hypothetical protein
MPMEEEQIIDACNAGLSGIPNSAKEYYNKTYKIPNTENQDRKK